MASSSAGAVGRERTGADALTAERVGERAGLTLEHAAYGVILLVAAWLRLLHLNGRPLGPDEAAQAWSAWRLAQGETVVGTGYSPLLLSLQYLSFLLLGAGDVVARLWPALVGSGMVLLPYGLRGRLGRGGALASALVMALSPTMVYFSRVSSGYILVAAAALSMLVALVRWREGDDRWLVAGAAAGGAMLIAGRVAWPALLILVGLAFWLGQVRIPDRKKLSRMGLLFALVAGLGSTALLLHGRGLGLAADLIVAWLGSFRAAAGGYPWYWLGLRLLLDEPLVLIVGLAGVAWGVRRSDRLATGLSLWAGVALLLFSVAGDRQSGDLLLVVVPLSLLAGQAIAGFVDNLRQLWTDSPECERALWRRPSLELALLVGVLLVLLVTLAIWLATYSRMHSVQYLWVALSPVGLMILILLLYGFWGGWRVALRALGTAALTILLLSSLSVAWGHSLDFRAGRQAGVLREKGSYGMRSLPETLETLSAQREGDPHELPIDVITEGPGHELRPVLGWALRDFVSLRWYEDRVPTDPASTVVAPAELEVALGDTYAGQDFPLVDVWTPVGLEGKPLWRWVLYREGPASPPTEDVVLWVDVTQLAGVAE